MTPRVAAATEADADALAALCRAVDSRIDVRAELALPHARLWIASLEPETVPSSTPAGFLLAWFVADEVELLELAVLPEWRRRGLGRALLAALLEEARSRGARLLTLEVRTGNTPALRLYEASGFRRARLRPGYYLDGEDAVEMHLALAAVGGASAVC